MIEGDGKIYSMILIPPVSPEPRGREKITSTISDSRRITRMS